MPRTFGDFAVFAAPAVFLLLWSSGFMVAKLGLQYAEPLTYLSLRMIVVVALLAIILALTRPKWPNRAGRAALAPPPASWCTASILAACSSRSKTGFLPASPRFRQPAAGPDLDDREPLARRAVVARQWLGLALGLLGVYLVVHDKTSSGGATPLAWVAATAALIGITVGTLYQKRFGGGIDWRPALCIQYGTAGFLFCLGASPSRPARCSGRRNSCSRSAISRSCSRSAGLALLLPDPPRGGDARGQPVLSHAADNGIDGLGVVQRAAGAIGARRHGRLRRRSFPGELAAAGMIAVGRSAKVAAMSPTDQRKMRTGEGHDGPANRSTMPTPLRKFAPCSTTSCGRGRSRTSTISGNISPTTRRHSSAPGRASRKL